MVLNLCQPSQEYARKTRSLLQARNERAEVCVSQEVNLACNVTHATLLLGLHQLAQYF